MEILNRIEELAANANNEWKRYQCRLGRAKSVPTPYNKSGTLPSNRKASEAICGNDDPKQHFEVIQVFETNDSYMSPLEYETDSDEETTNDRIEESANNTQEQQADMDQLQLATTNGLNCSSSKQATNRMRAKKIARSSLRCKNPNYRSDNLTLNLANRIDHRKAYICYLCKNAYKSKQWLRTHMLSKHTDQVPVRFSCSFQLCWKSFTQKSTLNRHIKSKHL